MWDLPGAGLEPVSPALAGRFLTTAPPGKSLPRDFFFSNLFKIDFFFFTILIDFLKISLLEYNGFTMLC